MAMFDTLVDDLASRYGLGANARTFISEVLALIANSPGGLGGFLDRLKSGGLTSEVASWLGRPDAAPLAAERVEQALGSTAVGGVANRLGLAPEHRGDRDGLRVAENRRPPDPRRRHPRWRTRGGYEIPFVGGGGYSATSRCPAEPDA